MSQSWTVRLEVVAPALDTPTEEEIRTVDIAASARSGATAGAKAVALAKSYGWRVLSIQDVKHATDEQFDPETSTEVTQEVPTKSNLLAFPTTPGKPN